MSWAWLAGWHYLGFLKGAAPLQPAAAFVPASSDWGSSISPVNGRQAHRAENSSFALPVVASIFGVFLLSTGKQNAVGVRG